MKLYPPRGANGKPTPYLCQCGHPQWQHAPLHPKRECSLCMCPQYDEIPESTAPKEKK